MTKVKCLTEVCIYNDKHSCTCEMITIDNNTHCWSYWPTQDHIIKRLKGE